MADISQLKKVVTLIAKSIQTGVQVAADGKVDWSDLSLILGAVPSLVSALDGIALVPSELAQLSADDAAELSAELIAQLALSDAKAEKVLEASLKILVGVVDLVAGLTYSAPASQAV